MSKFTDKAPKIMKDLMREFLCSKEDAAAVVGNLGHESMGFTKLQEMKPIVPGSRGGYGWAQWTGPRRKAFEAWCKKQGLEQWSDEANYGFLVHELRTTEKAMPAVMAAKGLLAKVKAFELGFERAHPNYKHYESRLTYAEKALDAFDAAFPSPLPAPPAPKPTIPVLPPPSAPPASQPTIPLITAIPALIVAAVAFFWDKLTALWPF